ncbi:MAG: VTT domain-containing protein [bacterium]
MSTLPAFAAYALEFPTYKYLLIGIGVAIEGPMLMIACGFLLTFGALDFFPLYISILVGDLVGDAAWYGVGRYFLDPFLERFGRYFGVSKELLNQVKPLFKKFHTRILFLSKITLGFGASIATLMTAGATHIPLKKYLAINFLGEILLVLALLGLGYSFGATYAQLAEELKYYFLIGLVIIVPTLIISITRYFKHKLLKV